MSFENFRSELPHIAAGYVHLNHAGVSAISSRVVSAIESAARSLSTGDPAAFGPAISQCQSCRSRLAGLLGVDSKDLAITKNTAHGISIVADGFHWREGDEVVFADCEYPANTYPWLAQRDRGVVCKVIPAGADGAISIDTYRQAMTSRTRMIAVSWVQFSTGFRSDLEALTRLAHANGARILVDVIQALGALPINLTALGVDFAATGSQKWLIGPMGVGGLYVKQDALNDLRLVNMGSGSVNNVFAFDPLGFDPKPTVQRYEEGTPNFFGMIGLDAALSMLNDAGVQTIEDSIRNITRYAIERLESAGYAVLSPKVWEQSAGIVLFRHPTAPNDVVLSALAEARVIVVARGGKIRFAPHFYNNESDIDRAIAALPAV